MQLRQAGVDALDQRLEPLFAQQPLSLRFLERALLREEGQPARTFSRESVWTLSPDGRTLTIDTKLQSPRGERTMKSVYTRSS